MLDYTITYNDKFLKLFEESELLKKIKLVRTVLCSLILDKYNFEIYILKTGTFFC